MTRFSPNADRTGYSMWAEMDDDHIEEQRSEHDAINFAKIIGCGIGLFIAALVYGSVLYAIDWIVELVKHYR